MPTTEAYRPGLLSSLLLGTEPEGAGAEGAATGKDAATAVAVSGTAQPPAEDQAPPSSTKKKKKKKAKRTETDTDEPAAAAAASPAADAVAPPKEKWPVVAAAPAPPEGVEGLASLFSPGNLKKFKRRERADKDADAAEVRVGRWVSGLTGVVG